MTPEARMGLLAVLIVASSLAVAASVVGIARLNQTRPATTTQRDRLAIVDRPRRDGSHQPDPFAAPLQTRSVKPPQPEPLALPAPMPGVAEPIRPERSESIQAPPTPVRQVSHDDPSWAALLRHPWWNDVVRSQQLDHILSLMTTHGEGVVFFNQAGQALWLSNQQVEGRPSLQWQWLLSFHVANAAAVPGVAELGPRRKLVILSPGFGRRLGRAQAMALLLDFLNVPDNYELALRNQQIINGFLQLGNQR